MEEDGPLVPRIRQRLIELLGGRNGQEPALRVGVVERARRTRNGLRRPRGTTGRQLQQRLGGLGGHVLGKRE